MSLRIRVGGRTMRFKVIEQFWKLWRLSWQERLLLFEALFAWRLLA
jgi:hypothetical protein